MPDPRPSTEPLPVVTALPGERVAPEPPLAKPPSARVPRPNALHDWPAIDLLERMPWLRPVLKWRPLQFWLVWPSLLVFSVFLYAGLFGTPVGNRNIIIVFVWIFWWFLLIAVLVPFASRLWCTMCPLPIFGEWLQRLRFTGVWSGKGPRQQRTVLLGLGRDWPKPLRNIWLQNIGFLGLAVFSALLVTRPLVSVGVLGAMIVLAVALAGVFRQRSFCMYLCPVSGFLSLYAMTSTLAVRAKDAELCRGHKEKECLLGCAAGYGCPWFQYPGGMERNNYCGMCFECFKTCPHDNMTLYLRPFCSDRGLKGVDEAYKAFIMLVLAMVYSVTLLGPWGGVKDWANASETGQWGGFGIYAGIIIGSCLVLFPGLHLGSVAIGRGLARRPDLSLRTLFVRYAYAWVPLGLLAWVAFSVPLIMVNGVYILNTLSDPMGRGWDLIGMTALPWHPLLPEWLGLAQVPILLVGLYFTLLSTWRIGLDVTGNAKSALRTLAPTWLLAVVVTGGLMALFLG